MRALSLVTIAIIVLVAACSSGGSEGSAPSPTPVPSPTIRSELLIGVLRLDVLDTAVTALTEGSPFSSCAGKRGYDDISEGAQVTVRNAEGKIVATTALSRGRVIGGTIVGECAFNFSVRVPVESDFYSVKIATRDELTYSVEDLDRMRWSLDLTLGQD